MSKTSCKDDMRFVDEKVGLRDRLSGVSVVQSDAGVAAINNVGTLWWRWEMELVFLRALSGRELRRRWEASTFGRCCV
jgi:hypothetical protein